LRYNPQWGEAEIRKVLDQFKWKHCPETFVTKVSHFFIDKFSIFFG
jgi:hypothetical protein